MMRSLASALSASNDATRAASDLVAGFGDTDARAIVFFCHHRLDGAALSQALKSRYPAAEVIGCTTAGEFTESKNGRGGVSAIALGSDKVRGVAGALARLKGGVAPGMQQATRALGERLKVDLRAADPKRYVGLALFDGLHMNEEAANEALGNAAPLLSFVGGSAGDDGEFQATHVFHNGQACDDGAALLLLDVAVPFVISKTCSFRPTGTSWTVTRADEAQRVVYSLDGKPVLDAYAAAVATTPARLDANVFMKHPVGLMIDDQPWIRSPMRALPDGGLKFYCRISEGMQVHLMESTDLVEDLRGALADAEKRLGRPFAGGVAFNCILRRLEMDAGDLHTPMLRLFGGRPVAGFHTYGESWLGHMNQTLTALWLA
jgi:hypothetical protein